MDTTQAGNVVPYAPTPASLFIPCLPLPSPPLQTIMGVESISGLRVLAVNLLGKFLANKVRGARGCAGRGSRGALAS